MIVKVNDVEVGFVKVKRIRKWKCVEEDHNYINVWERKYWNLKIIKLGCVMLVK